MQMNGARQRPLLKVQNPYLGSIKGFQGSFLAKQSVIFRKKPKNYKCSSYAKPVVWPLVWVKHVCKNYLQWRRSTVQNKWWLLYIGI